MKLQKITEHQSKWFKTLSQEEIIWEHLELHLQGTQSSINSTSGSSPVQAAKRKIVQNKQSDFCLAE